MATTGDTGHTGTEGGREGEKEGWSISPSLPPSVRLSFPVLPVSPVVIMPPNL